MMEVPPSQQSMQPFTVEPLHLSLPASPSSERGESFSRGSGLGAPRPSKRHYIDHLAGSFSDPSEPRVEESDDLHSLADIIGSPNDDTRVESTNPFEFDYSHADDTTSSGHDEAEEEPSPRVGSMFSLSSIRESKREVAPGSDSEDSEGGWGAHTQF